MNRIFLKLLSLTLATTLIIGTLPVAHAGSGMVGTDAVIAHDTFQFDRNSLLSLLDTDGVAEALTRQGVSLDEARARIAAMSPQEVQMLNERMESLPAGGNALGILFSIFIILLVTDLLGLTKVFPFTRR